MHEQALANAAVKPILHCNMTATSGGREEDVRVRLRRSSMHSYHTVIPVPSGALEGALRPSLRVAPSADYPAAAGGTSVFGLIAALFRRLCRSV